LANVHAVNTNLLAVCVAWIDHIVMGLIWYQPKVAPVLQRHGSTWMDRRIP
jgi:hypothetical protein